MGRVQLGRLQEFKRIRRRNAMALKKLLAKYQDKLILPLSNSRADVCWYTFPITLKSVARKKVLQALDKANIEWRPILSSNIARQPAFVKQVRVYDKLNNADELMENSFWVSVHPTLSLEVMKYVADTIRKALL